jgi:hypothetical protein
MPNDTFSGELPPTFVKFERQDIAIRDYLAQHGFRRDGSKGEWEAFYDQLPEEKKKALWPGLREIMRKLG